MTLHHLVEPAGEGSEVTIAMEAPGPLEPALAETYGRAFPLLLRRLAREAEGDSPTSLDAIALSSGGGSNLRCLDQNRSAVAYTTPGSESWQLEV